MTPHAHAMSLVNNNAAQPDLIEKGKKSIGKQSLGRDVKQLNLAFARIALNLILVTRRKAAVKARCRNAPFDQSVHLILH